MSRQAGKNFALNARGAVVLTASSDGVRKYICGKVKRELIPATFRVYPVKDYGAIEEGEHRFCELATGRCEGIARFVMVWAKQDDAWRIISVFSYGDRAATPADSEAPPTASSWGASLLQQRSRWSQLSDWDDILGSLQPSLNSATRADMGGSGATLAEPMVLSNLTHRLSEYPS